MNLGDLSDEELYRAAGVDNLARQQKRGAGVDKFADPENLADEDLFAVAGIKPGGRDDGYEKWRAKLPARLQSDADYDLRGFYRKNPNWSPDAPDAHMTDEFKLPNHPTFSNESRYYNKSTERLGGHWAGNVFIPNDPGVKSFQDENPGADPNDPLPAWLAPGPRARARMAPVNVSPAPRSGIREYDMVGGKAVPRPVRVPGQLPPDAITSEELYALGSSPESLKAHLNAQAATERKPAPSEWSRIKDRWMRPPMQQLREIPEDLTRAAGMVNGAVNAATAGAYNAARRLVGGYVAPEANAAAMQSEERVAREQPFGTGLVSGAGYLSPWGPVAKLGQAAGVAGEAIGSLLPRFLERPVAGAVTGALGAGGLGAAETLADGGSLADAGDAALRGAKYGGIAGAGVGTVQGVAGRLAEGADRRISARNISDFTDGASAARRDRVVGKGGQKYDRIDSLARRTPELEQAAGDPLKQAPIVQQQIDRTGAQLDSIYDGVRVPHNVVSDPLREVAAEIRSRPHTSQQAAVADALDMEARHVSSTWRNYAQDGGVDARDARQMITSYGKGLFRGNPNSPVNIPTEIKRDVYARQTQNLGRMVEYMKPGVSEELAAANAEMSDWLNIADAVGARASRAATPGMTLKGQAHNILDTALGVMHPGHYLLKKGVEHFGPGAIRAADNQLSLGRAAILDANPLVRALENEREQSRRRAELLRREQLTRQQFEEEERQRRAQEAFQQQN